MKLMLVEKDMHIINECKKKIIATDNLYELVVKNTDFTSVVEDVKKEKPSIILMAKEIKGFDMENIYKQVNVMFPEVPIILLGENSDTASEEVRALEELGADDYLKKPLRYHQLFAKVKAILRRIDVTIKNHKEHLATIETKTTNNVSLVGTQIYGFKFEDNYQLTYKGKDISLTSREYELFESLAKNKERVMTREALLLDVWGFLPITEGDKRIVDITIKRLREKLEAHGLSRHWIITKRGLGYIFARQNIGKQSA